ncbi:MAG: polyphosphate kinase 2 family protein [Gemmatimonadota bacterium]|nr:MAG: polyphosphate kinase 2 family protein [Gemmatimonadota bacterium]
MFDAVESPYLVPTDGSFTVASALTGKPQDAPKKKHLRQRLARATERLSELQRVLYAHDRYSVLLIFQAMDAAGKDSTIRSVLTGVNPAGCQVFSFKQPSKEELDHDFLWRTSRNLPERGRIGVFNRSYYEEVLVVRVHPEILESQRLPRVDRATVWQERLESIRNHEQHLAMNGTIVLKFWLNVSKEEQRQRFLARLDEPDKNWKFAVADCEERRFWGEYMAAYEEALNATSRSWAPWYAVPADSKPYMRVVVAELVVATLERLNLEYPSPEPEDQAKFNRMRELLEGDEH